MVAFRGVSAEAPRGTLLSWKVCVAGVWTRWPGKPGPVCAPVTASRSTANGGCVYPLPWPPLPA